MRLLVHASYVFLFFDCVHVKLLSVCSFEDIVRLQARVGPSNSFISVTEVPLTEKIYKINK